MHGDLEDCQIMGMCGNRLGGCRLSRGLLVKFFVTPRRGEDVGDEF
jgi:hypothetical protein